MQSIWSIIHECDDDNGNPTCWTQEINHDLYGQFVWIIQHSDNEYVVEVMPDDTNSIPLATCKSLSSAKRWVAINIG